jgi:hypothetical protein
LQYPYKKQTETNYEDRFKINKILKDEIKEKKNKKDSIKKNERWNLNLMNYLTLF